MACASLECVVGCVGGSVFRDAAGACIIPPQFVADAGGDVKVVVVALRTSQFFSRAVFFITFNRIVTGLSLGDFSVTGGTADRLTGAGTQYRLEVESDGSSLITVSLPADVVADADGNPNEESNEAETIIQLPPIPTLTGPAFITEDEFSVNLAFNMEVVNFNDAYVEIVGGTLATVAGGGDNFGLSIVRSVGASQVLVRVLAGAAESLSGAPSRASGWFRTVYDATPPAPALTPVDGRYLTNQTVFEVQLSFSERVTPVDLDMLTVTNATLSDLVELTPSRVWKFKVTAMGSPVTLDFAEDQVTDTAGNDNVAATQLIIVTDTVAPTCTLTAPSHSDVEFTLLVNFSERVLGFDAGDLRIVGGVLRGFTVIDELRYSARIRPTVGVTETVITVLAGAARDYAGNLSQGPVSLTVINQRFHLFERQFDQAFI